MTVMTDNEQTNKIECKKREIKMIEERRIYKKKRKKVSRNEQWKYMYECG